MTGWLTKLPPWIQRFAGVRQGPVKQIPTWRSCLWSFFGSFSGMAIAMILFHYSQHFARYNIPLIVSSWGATAILIYGTPEAPLAQPRGVIFGTLISSIIGVAINKMFLEINTPARIFIEVQWVAAATTIGITLVVMILTRTVHPPCGATALLPIAQQEIADLGWFYVAVMVLACTIMLVWAMIVDNIERRYPVYWWKPTESPKPDPQEAPATTKRSPSPPLTVPMTLPTTLPTQNNELHSLATENTRCHSIAIPQFLHIPPGVLDAREEATLRQIYQKLRLDC